MPEQRVHQQFIDSADLKYQWAQTLARPIDEAAQALLAFMASPQAAPAKRRQGMEPA